MFALPGTSAAELDKSLRTTTIRHFTDHDKQVSDCLQPHLSRVAFDWWTCEQVFGSKYALMLVGTL